MGYELLIERLTQLARRIGDYPRHEVLIELGVLWLAVYLVLRWLRGTRGARAIKGMAMVLIVATILVKLPASDTAFERLNFLYGNFLILALLAILIVFQPELRRLMVRLGEARFFLAGGLGRTRTVDEIAEAVTHLARNKIGALIAVERQVGLKGIVEGGTILDARVSRELLCTVFWPGSALHDLGVIIQGDRVVAAGVQFPLAEEDKFDTQLGSRHRAAIGLSQEADALVIVVSEETGAVSVASRGRLHRNLSPAQLAQRLARSLRRGALAADTEPDVDNDETTAQAT